ncbi:hypothetical protein MJ389_08420 [Escherichia coli]|nr:hypothetical protein MJ389_08420 [Escherichia coli]
MLTDWLAIAPDLDQVLVALDEPPARTINTRASDSRPALLKTSGGYRFRDAWLPPRYAPLSP